MEAYTGRFKPMDEDVFATANADIGVVIMQGDLDAIKYISKAVKEKRRRDNKKAKKSRKKNRR